MRPLLAALILLIASALTAAQADSMFLLFGAGSSGGAPPTGCANQLVFDYSNSCALIAQAWGQ